jgi:hypothetical protein
LLFLINFAFVWKKTVQRLHEGALFGLKQK